MSTSLQDVAREAGVSLKTVSRVVNNEKNVAADTRAHVMRIVEELGYVPHAMAQRLASGRTRSIALHFPLADPALISNQIEMSFITGVAQEAAEAEYFFSLMTGQMTHSGLLKLCRGAQADGLVLMQVAMNDWRVEVLREHDYPFVMIGRTDNNSGLSYIDLDFETAVVDAYRYLVNLGHRHIGLLTFSKDWRTQGFTPAIKCLSGFNAAVERFHLAPIYRECQQEVERAYWTTKRLLTQHPDLSAFLVTHNTMAVGALRALQELNRKIPEDCSIVGLAFGNEAELFIPALTAVEWSGYEIGRRAARMLVDELRGDSMSPRQVLIPPKLQVRRSAAPVEPL